MAYSIRRSRTLYRQIVGSAALALGVASCIWHRSSGTEGDSLTITAAEIDSVHAENALDAVRKLRPRFLASRGKLSLGSQDPPALPNVYVDNMYYGDATTLQGITAGSIESIHFYSASEAQYTFGRGNMAGVISIATKH